MATDEERAEQLMAKGPIWLVRRVMELEALSAKKTKIPGGAERKAGSP